MSGLETIVISNTIILVINTITLFFNSNVLWKAMDSNAQRY
jgi:hypothetical protein